MSPMLPDEYSEGLVTYPCFIQPKLKGIRALYQIGVFQPCNGLLWRSESLRHLTEPLAKIFNASVILDGALYVHDWPFERLTDALAKPSSDTPLLEFHVFDVVNFHRPFGSRFMAPGSILLDTQHRHKVKVVETHRLDGGRETEEYFFNKWIDAGYDGAIYRLNNSPYTPGKSKDLLKRERPSSTTRKSDECGECDPNRPHAQDLSTPPPAGG